MSTAPHTAPDNPLRDELHNLRSHWVMLFLLGLCLVLVGTMAIVSSFIATLATVTIFGSLLFVGAIFQVVNAITCRNWRGFVAYLIAGILYGVVGLIMMNDPGRAALALTLMLAAAFMVAGILRITVAAVERFHSWPWVMLSGFISLFLGIFIWRHFPADSLWLIGLLVGIDLIFSGWAWILLALGIRSTIPKKIT